MKYNLSILLAGLFLFISCDDDLDDVVVPASTSTVSEFVYRGLNIWSLYKEDVPELANDFFDSQTALTEYLDQFETPEATFEALTSQRDRFSIIRSDYIELENALSGIRISNGMNFSLFIDPTDNTKAFGAVRYVVNGSPADQAGIERGMLFTSVNGVALQETNGGAITNETSFSDLFAPDTYEIGLATFDEVDGFTATGEEISITKTALTVNPVHIAKTLDVDGEPVGYLHYTSFTNEFDSALNEAFAQFKNDGVTDLILDLRYNGGGSVETANDLSTMITGQFEGEVFITQQFNEDRNPANESIRYFNNNLGSEENGAAINSLGLSTVYILTSSRTASASELIISGLDPYINIVQIGTSTTGKFEGSFLLYDSPDFRRANANPNHRYVMLPLTFKSVNANGFSDYFEGLSPDIEIAESFRTYGTLGEPGEPLLDAALDAIVNGRSVQKAYNTLSMPSLYETEETELLYQRMITDPASSL